GRIRPGERRGPLDPGMAGRVRDVCGWSGQRGGCRPRRARGGPGRRVDPGPGGGRSHARPEEVASMSDRSRPGGSRRRMALQRERRINPMVLLSVGVPLLTVAALASVSPAPTEDAGRAPGTAPLTSSVVVCGPDTGGVGDVRLAL